MAKKIPLRQCLGCREMMPKEELVRVVKNAEGEIQLDLQGKLPGRGAYLCKKERCFKKIIKSKALERSFSASISPEIYQALEDRFTTNLQEVNAVE